MALLEADVNFRVARDLVGRIRERALQEEVLRSLSPGQQVVKITNEELTATLDGGSHRLETSPRRPSVAMMVGLNGSGKTTTAAKLARHLSQQGQAATLIAADLQRPAAPEQLETLGKQVGVDVYRDESGADTPRVARDGVRRASEREAAWAIVDTAGRFQVDDDLMAELERVKKAVSPVETLLVVDAMAGQDAVNAAQEFHRRIGITGLVLTKMDGDARGGAALSITAVTGVPIKFIGTGERVDALEAYFPDRLASRILGMGDVLTLIDKAQTTISEEEALDLERKIRQASFDLEDFLAQLQHLKSMGPLSQIVEMIPGLGGMKGRLSSDEVGDDQLKKVEAIIYSMTPEERSKPNIIGGSRRRRIARGSGTRPQDVNMLLNQFRQMQKMLRQMNTGRGSRQMRRMMRQGGLFGG